MLSSTSTAYLGRVRAALTLAVVLAIGAIVPMGTAHSSSEEAPEVSPEAPEAGGATGELELPPPPDDESTLPQAPLVSDDDDAAPPAAPTEPAQPPAAPALTPLNGPPPPVEVERMFTGYLAELHPPARVTVKGRSNYANIYDATGALVDSLAAPSTSNFSFTHGSVDHPSLYLETPDDNPNDGSGITHRLRCENPNTFHEVLGSWCTITEPFEVIISWTIAGKLQSCVTATGGWVECPDTTVNTTEIYQYYPSPPDEEEHDPVAMFTATQSANDPYEFSFENRSSDEDSEFSTLQFAWDFGDEETSTEAHPTHQYARGGTYTVVLVVTDPTGRTARHERSVEVASELIVNSTGDAPATDPSALGCDTGGTIGVDAAPECTLRAAIETATERGSGEVTFAIDGEPHIALGARLPTVTGTTSIDGTTQPGGWVEVVGGGEATLTLGEGTVSVTGLALHGAGDGIRVSAGTEHVIEGNRIGVSRTQAPTEDTEVGVSLRDSGDIAAVRGNVIAATGIGIINSSEGTIGEITGNSIGVTEAGEVLADVEAGVLLFGSGASQIEDNLIRAPMFGIMVIGVQASGTSIRANRVGTTGTTAFEEVGTGIVVEAAADVVVDNNTVVAGDWGGILVAGSVQVAFEDDGGVDFLPPFGHVLGTPVSATRVKITDNTVTAVAGSSGIVSWADASELTISGNTITESGEGGGISLAGGMNHLVTDNVLGAAGSILAGSGVWLTDTTTSTVSANTIFMARYGIHIDWEGTGATITQNVVTGNGNERFAGVFVEGEREGVVVTNNTVADAGVAGIDVDGPAAEITSNTVTNSGHGITAKGTALVIADNQVGVAAGSAAVIGNSGNGISITAGNGTVRGNTIAGSGSNGIHIAPEATATLRANRIWESGGDPIRATHAAPHLKATLITDTGITRRTTLLITGIPADGGGTIEVFANASCAAGDAEAKYLMSITRDVEADQGMKLIQFESRRDHFTITYTNSDGETSRLSNCESRTVYPDSDGDGSPDVIDELYGSAQDPRTAVLVTTKEQLLVVSTDIGALRNVRVMHDPVESHPAGWVLPYGVLGFEIVGLEPGGSAQMTLSALYSDGPLQGDSYWKYGPATAGASPDWYPFTFDSVTGTGATMTTVTMGDLGFRRAFELTLVDGARGDSDGVANGTIVDPGGPVIFDTSGENSDQDPSPDTPAENGGGNGPIVDPGGALIGPAGPEPTPTAFPTPSATGSPSPGRPGPPGSGV